MLATAEKVLGYDLLKLCLEGPKEKLDDTVYSQPALFVAGALADTHPGLLHGCHFWNNLRDLQFTLDSQSDSAP